MKKAQKTIKAAPPAEKPVSLMQSNVTETDWKGHVNYECNLCPFSTLDKPLMARHQVAHHAPPLEKPALAGLIVDTGGDPITTT